MPRKLRKSSFSGYEALLWIAGSNIDPMEAEVKLPQEPWILQGIVFGLLTRIANHNTNESRILSSIIRSMAIKEDLFSSPARTPGWEKFSADLKSTLASRFQTVEPANGAYDLIISVPTPRNTTKGKASHNKQFVKVQYELLRYYFEHNQYKSKVRNDKARVLWIKDHESEIFNLIKGVPCNHYYPKSIRSIAHIGKEYSSVTDFCYLVLSHLHQTTKNNIRKILSHR